MNVEESETIIKDKLNDDSKNQKYKGEHDGHLPMFLVSELGLERGLEFLIYKKLQDNSDFVIWVSCCRCKQLN